MGLPGHGSYSHLRDPIVPAGVDFGAAMTDKDSTWPEFRDRRIAALDRAGGRMIWPICDNESFAPILLDDSLQRGTGYAAISTFHFWTRNMAYTRPHVFRYRHELPFVALQDARGVEAWWWSDNLTGAVATVRRIETGAHSTSELPFIVP